MISEFLIDTNQYDIYNSMWRTQIGDRILDGAEAVLFAKALSSLLNEAMMGTLEDYKFNIESFDNLTLGQRISVSAIIGNGLLREDVPLVRLTAILEGAIAAVFKHIQNEIAYEIDEPESRSNWRELVVAASELFSSGRDEIPETDCTDMYKWKFELELLLDKILFDTDYEDSKLYMDFPPEKSKELREQMDIPDDYFMAIADDLTDEEAQAKIKELKKLCNSFVRVS